jgi:Tol biopolymer transport system component
MAIHSDSRIGPYEIAEVVGSGGMGEVYRARDTTLERDVAIKRLPESFASDADRVARFQQEAKVLASLNHPNIAQVYGLEQSDEGTAIVMELVEGPTLADRIEQGPIPADEALGIAMQIADALEAAHDKGIVHRDLKPANIKLRPDGTVKVLDFGIAKAFDPASLISGPQSPVMTTPVTQAGIILGTAAYMSPEQARGKPVDQRTDIWAFGCVLFEMLTGQPVFAGEDVSITLARVLERDTNLDSIPAAISPAVRHTIALCLRKDPRKRLHSIGDVRLALTGELAPDPALPGSAAPGATAASRWRRALPLAAGLVLGGGLVGAAVWGLARDEAPRPVARFSEPMEPVPNLPGLTISDDGAQIAYTEGSPPQLMLRRVDEFEAQPIGDVVIDRTQSSTLTGMCFSPAGDWIAYLAANGTELRKIPVTGGRGLTLVENLTSTVGACDWAADGFIYFGADGIARVSESGGAVEHLSSPDTAAGEAAYADPQVLPGGKVVAFTILTGTELGDMRVGVLDLETGETQVVLDSAGVAAFAPTGPEPGDGYFLYGLDGALFAAPFDSGRREAGPVRPVIDEVLGLAGISFVAVSQSGTLAYLDGDFVILNGSLNWVDRSGQMRSATDTAVSWGELSLSPDGQHAAAGVVDLTADNLTAEIWTLDFDGGRASRRSFEGGLNGSIVWIPGGDRMLYASFGSIAGNNPTLKSVPTDGSESPTTIARFDQFSAYPTSISPDGETLIGTGRTISGGTQNDIWSLSLDDELARDEPATESDVSFLLDSPFDESHATFSPDGRWIAYASDESGEEQIYVIPYPGPGGKYQVSTDGGRQPRWNPTGGEIFYLNGPRMMAVDVETDARFRAGNPRVLFENAALLNPIGGNTDGFQYAVSPDGNDFLILSGGSASGQRQQLRVVENWFEELERQVPR